MATMLTLLIEKPSMNWLRVLYRHHSLPSLSWQQSMAIAGLGLTIFSSLAYAWHESNPRPIKLADLVEHIYLPTTLDPVPCQFGAKQQPLMVLVLGQSNAGNHGELASPLLKDESAKFFFNGRCFNTNGPAPGATGEGGNLWTALAPGLAAEARRPVVFSVLAVESTRLRDWLVPGKLRQKLIDTLAEQHRYGFDPNIVLWQQGEADAKAGTTRMKYQQQFSELVLLLRNEGVLAPIATALSTHCGNDSSNEVRQALTAIARQDPSVHIGPDTDMLTGPNRQNDCHFSNIGRRNAAQLWLTSITPFVRLGESPVMR